MTERAPGVKATARAGALRVAAPLRRLVAARDQLRRENLALAAQLDGVDARMHELVDQRDKLSRDLADLRSGQSVDDYRYLFVIAYGRSGSTLVQGILNSIPGYLIRGENMDAFYKLGEYHRALVAAKQEHHAATSPTYAWYGIGDYDAEAAITQMRGLALHTLLRPGPDTRVVGYKEIRWWHSHWQRHFAFLRELFPGARFVLNNRNHENVAKSKWWAERPDALERLSRYEERLDEMAGHLGADAYRLNFDEFVADPDVLKGLYEWLGEDFDRARIDQVMAVKHSS